MGFISFFKPTIAKIVTTIILFPLSVFIVVPCMLAGLGMWEWLIYLCLPVSLFFPIMYLSHAIYPQNTFTWINWLIVLIGMYIYACVIMYVITFFRNKKKKRNKR